MPYPTPAAGLVASVEEVAVRVGADPAALPAGLADRILAALQDAQADVERDLNRPVVPTAAVMAGVVRDSRYPATSYKAWPASLTLFDDQVTIVSYTPTVGQEGLFDVAVLVGVDGANEPPIRRHVVAGAVELLRHDPAVKQVKRRVSSVSADGQSVSYEKAQADELGAAPTRVQLMRRWKRPVMFSRAREPEAPWPYRTGTVYWPW